jgi:hypothetical protein
MTRIYRAIVDGPFPLALAPEGQVSYTADLVPRLEQGVIRIGFAAADRMARAEKPAPVEILPISVYFRFGSWGKFTLELLLRKIEKAAGFRRRGKAVFSFTERLRVCRDRILEVNERRYCIKRDPALSFEERLDAVIAAALESAERILGVRSSGDHFSRIYRLRQICWDRIVLPGVDTLGDLSGIERGITDLCAGEAWYAGRHLEMVDFSWYFRVPLPADDAPLHHRIEYAQNLWDFANRTMGGAYANRISIFPRRVIIQAAPPINLSERLPAYHNDKKSAISSAMADLKQAYMDCIDETP